MIRKKKKDKEERFKVVKCSALNVRQKPSVISARVDLLTEDEIIECDLNFKNDEWEHIITNSGIDGFCMKKFLEPLGLDKTAEPKKEPDSFIEHNPECDGSRVTIKEAKDGDKEN